MVAMKCIRMETGERGVKMWLSVIYIAACLVLSLISPAASQTTMLPQSHDYQVTLRSYMESLTVSDFEVGLKPLTYDFEFFESTDHLFQAWILFRQAPPQGPVVDVKGITVAPEHFILSSIETEEGIIMGSPGNFPWISPETTVWWATWNYPGNPYYGNEALKRRAFVYSAVDMMLHDEAHENGEYRRSDYLGATLTWMAYSYYKARDILPEEVREAYETGLLKFFERIEEWGPRGNAGDMDQFAHLGLWYTAQAIGREDLLERSKEHSRHILEEHLRPAGYIDHGDGFDPSYNGISLDLLGWAALATGHEFFAEALEKMSNLKAHLTLPEPDGEYYGPSHFSTATSEDSPNDLRGRFKRDIGIAMVADHAKYLVWEGRSGVNTGYGVPEQEEMLDRITLLTRRTNNHLEPSDSAPEAWRQKNWTNGIIYAYDYYRKGFYNELVGLNQEQSPLRRLPINQDENYIQQFPDQEDGVREQNKDEFMTAKFKDYALIIHTGRLSFWGGTEDQSGFGGGALSAFWTRETGSVILGRTGGFQGPAPDTWENWRQWPTHAISGVDNEGDAFSSARYRYPSREYMIEGQLASITAYGAVGNDFDGGRTTEEGQQSTRFHYSRNFDIDAGGLTITSSVRLNPVDEIAELYELIPIFLGGRTSNTNRANTTVSFMVDGDWVDPGNSMVANVGKVRIERHEGSAYIDFSTPQQVMLSPDIWEDQYQSDARVQNLLIDMLEAETNQSGDIYVRYTLHPGE